MSARPFRKRRTSGDLRARETLGGTGFEACQEYRRPTRGKLSNTQISFALSPESSRIPANRECERAGEGCGIDTFFSPKGWDSLARGSALGREAFGSGSLKGCDPPRYPRPSTW